jgi:hypothetical protein
MAVQSASRLSGTRREASQQGVYGHEIPMGEDAPRPALSPRPWDRYCAPWPAPSRQAMIPLPRAALGWPHLPTGPLSILPQTPINGTSLATHRPVKHRLEHSLQIVAPLMGPAPPAVRSRPQGPDRRSQASSAPGVAWPMDAGGHTRGKPVLPRLAASAALWPGMSVCPRSLARLDVL